MSKITRGTEPSEAPVVVPAVPVVQATPPRLRQIERRGSQTVAYTRRLPQIRGGICEYCGVLDSNVPSQFQYQICPHFRGLGEMRCSYCDETMNPTDVILHSNINVAEHPDNPDKLVVWCNSYACAAKHEARFKVNR